MTRVIKNLIKKFITLIFYLFVEFYLFLHKEKQKKQNDKTIKKLLIIRIDAIGDFIIFSPMLRYYRILYPNYHITLLVNEEVLNLAQRINEIDELIPFNRKKIINIDLIYIRRLLKKIKEESFDVVIYPTYSREPIGDYIVRLSRAREKIGFDGDICNITLKKKLKNNKYYTKLISARPDIIFETERNKEFIEGLGLKVTNSIPNFTPSNEDKKIGCELLFNNGLKSINNFIVINPGAQWKGRIWPLKKYVEVVVWLKKEKNIDIVICGSKNEYSLAEKIKTISNIPIINISDKTSLPVLAAILKESLLYIGNESGITHLASTVGVPTICIMGGGHFGRFFPYGDLKKNRIVYYKMNCFNCNWKCIYPNKRNNPMPCISNIEVNSVLEEIKKVLSG